MSASRIARYLAVAVFLALALAPAVLLTVPGPWPGSTLPKLQPFRPLPSGILPGWRLMINNWFSDRIGLRLPLLWLGAQITDKVWQPRVCGNAIIGEYPWLFWTDNESAPASLMADVRGELRLPQADLRTIENTLRQVRAAFSACGKRAFLMIVPNKQSIYPELMREDHAGYRRSRLDDFIERLAPDVRPMVIEPRPALRAAKYAHPAPLFYATDTHWNALGAYYAYRTVMAKLAEIGAVYAPERAALDNFALTIKPHEGGDIATRILFVSDRFTDISPLLTPKLPLRAATPRQDVDRLTHTNPDGRGRLVINGDSFAPEMAEFLALHFEETAVFTKFRTGPAFDGEMASRLRADVFIIEIVERFLPVLAIAPRNLDKVCAGGR